MQQDACIILLIKPVLTVKQMLSLSVLVRLSALTALQIFHILRQLPARLRMLNRIALLSLSLQCLSVIMINLSSLSRISLCMM